MTRVLWCLGALALVLCAGPALAALEGKTPDAGNFIGPIGVVTGEEIKSSEDKQESMASEKEAGFLRFFRREDLTFIPLPAFAYNRNERYWAGGLMPILKTNPRGEITDLVAPQYLYNQFVGHNGSLNYYGYRSDTAQYHAVVSYAEKVERTIDLSYKDLGAGGGRYIIWADGAWFKNPFARFFGLGNNSKESNESNYTSRETNLKLAGGINLSPDLSILITERYRDVRLDNGVVPSLPQTTTAFRTTAGVEGAQIFGTKLTFLYDTRDSQLTPVKGRYLNLSGEFNTNVQHAAPNRWLRFTLDARQLIPHDSDRKVLVLHFLADGVIRTDETLRRTIPFYERPMLGGENTLRAFGLNRFFSDTAWLVNVEERMQIAEKRVFDHNVDLQVAPFVDMGRVQRLDRHSFSFEHTQVNPGVGFRVLARPYVVGRLDAAYGKDGGNVFVGLDYPF